MSLTATTSGVDALELFKKGGHKALIIGICSNGEQLEVFKKIEEEFPRIRLQHMEFKQYFMDMYEDEAGVALLGNILKVETQHGDIVMCYTATDNQHAARVGSYYSCFEKIDALYYDEKVITCSYSFVNTGDTLGSSLQQAGDTIMTKK